ncbi:glycosyltransferase family 2 protein [Lutimonas sp.]|uniref:glycosyltransferase family 2 protein n=1 Tax=Lutimonas sp. TaxID=1872403 RepID=UPI003C7167B8
MKIAIVILNWNGQELMEKFLPSVVAHSIEDATICVADNNSTDDSIAFLKEHYPQVQIIQNEINGGFAKGYNDALKHVDADVYALVNSDIEVSENWLKPIKKVFEQDSNTAIIQPKILDYKDKTKFEYAGAAGGFVDFMGYPFCRGRIFMNLEQDQGQFNDVADIFWASGACFFIKSAIYHQLGGFDEQYFAHQEEIDLCWRVQNEGYAIKYVGGSEVYHVGGATLRESNPQKTYLNFRNSLFTIAKNVPKRFVFIVIFLRLILDAVAGIKFILELRPIHTWAIIRAHLSFYWHLRKMMSKRRALSFKRTNYFYCFSIVWEHFILRKKRFSSIK